ncbi:MAG TPA: peptide ABC transporter ATP-binding protein [Blastocatellia bacterium]|jgi:oligopeptide transport system ATP-binding protein|nr:peptide ABC transporter ATP-binding protein [Blastocatellia bacterium]
MTNPNGNLLEVRELRTYFDTEDGEVKAVDGVTFQLKRGETLGIVGESGSGKSVTNLSIIRLIPQPPGKIVSGEIVFDGVDILSLAEKDVRKIRGRRIAMIFQDPMTSLNPFMKISRQVMEITQLHLGHTKRQAFDHAVRMLETVGIPDARARANNYPHEFSGGMRQRVMIAMALSCEPELLIADEPTTALDVTIQAQILELIKTLKRATGTSVILITHDLGVVAGMTDHLIVMYAGKVFEQAPTSELFALPGNPYTKGLLRSVPDPTAEQGALYQIPGLPPDLAHLPPGCPFAARCDRAQEICREEFPPFVQVAPEHYSLCHFADQVYNDSRREALTNTLQKGMSTPPQ